MDVNYDELAEQLFILHNKIREDPKSFIIKLKRWLNKFRDKTLFLLNENPLETFEGITAVEEAMRFLSVQKPVPKLALSEELSKAAKDHALDIGENNLFGHEGSDKSMLSDRIERYTEWDESCAESIDLGFKNADNIILNLLTINKFQEEDPDAPDDTIDVKISKSHKTVSGKDKRITKKIYTLKDQSLHILEIEEN